MVIPPNITRESIIQALKDIDEDGVPVKRQIHLYALVHEGKPYPPKFVLNEANKIVNRIELDYTKYDSGDANDFLQERGFQIVTSDALDIDSWTLVSDQVALKRLDRSAFYHNGTGVPIEVRPFFGLEGFSKGESRDTVLIYHGKRYPAVFSRKKDKDSTGRTQLHWHSDFERVLRIELPKWYKYFGVKASQVEDGPELRFSKADNKNEYLVTILDIDKIQADIESEIIENQGIYSQPEGKAHQYYGTRVERSAANRRAAIRIHGWTCAACGFDYSEVYGDRGKEWIEVHHIKPLSTFQGETMVTPETDLIPVCANCHRMIHRDSKNVLSVDELKELIKRTH